MCAFNRISKNKIRNHSKIINPNIVIIVDDTLMNKELFNRYNNDTIYLINSNKSVQNIKLCYNIYNKIYIVDATKITMEEFYKNKPNTPLLGALSKLFDININDVIKTFINKFNGVLNDNLINSNIKSIIRGGTEIVYE